MKEISLTKGKVTMVDDEDYGFLSRYRWHCTSEGYAKSTRGLYMHRMLAGAGANKIVVDHINGNKLDNRRSNLRATTQKVNINNAHRTGRGSSKYVGVYRSEYLHKWVAQFRGKHLGVFIDEVEAANAYQTAREKYLTTREVLPNV